ncbi:hypothetical protein ACEZ3G_09880 [Maribacter algicola]|uniref:Uncharacterized protein n=1 Tax=Meishania litoralis TaxID=3434685 RepID=A0ACC7LJN8_9FLAO
MKNKTTAQKRFHETITTKHVFTENEQVFMKRDWEEYDGIEVGEEIWYPINFQWIPVKILEKSLTHQSNIQ